MKAVQAIFFIGNEILCVERKSGLLGFPGGKVEEEEKLSEAVLRELFEETGLIGMRPKLLHTEYYNNHDQYAFEVVLYPGKIIFEENRKAMLLSIDEFIAKSEWPEYNRRVLKKVKLI